MVEFFYEDVRNLDLKEKIYTDWFQKVVSKEKKVLGEIGLILCTDDYLLEINQQHLRHDYYTDIITFDYCYEDVVSGDLFVSTERVEENAKKFNASFIDELNRVFAHGVLHLCGYSDKTKSEQTTIRQKEDEALLLLRSL